MKSFFNIDTDYDDVIKCPHLKLNMEYTRECLLKLTRPYTPKEKELFNKISYMLQLQKEIETHKKKRNNFLKKVLANEGIFVH